MAGLAGHTGIEKRLCAEMIVRSGWFLYAAGMAVQAARIHLERERHFPCVQRFWIHIPHPLLAVPVDRALEPKSVFLEQVGAPSLARSDEIDEFLFPFESLVR